MFKFEVIPTPFIGDNAKGTAICTSPHFLGIGLSTGAVYLLNLETYGEVHVFNLFEDPPTRISISPDEKYLAVVSQTQFYIVEIEKQSAVTRVTAHADGVTSLSWGM